MKNYFLPAIFWVITLSTTFAQQNQVPGLSTFSALAPASVRELLGQTGLLQKNEPGLTDGINSVLQLDSTINFTGFSAGNTDSEPFERAVFSYPQSGVQLVTNAVFDNGAWSVTGKGTSISDNLGRVVSSQTEIYDAGTGSFTPEYRVEIFPHGSSLELQDSFFVYSWDASIAGWQQTLAAVFTYDGQDRIQQVNTSFDFIGTTLIFKDVYAYDANGDNHLIDHFNIFAGFEIPAGKTEQSFDNHLLVESIEYSLDNSDFAPQTRTLNTYNSAELVETTSNFDWDADLHIWTLTNQSNFTYDNQGRLYIQEDESNSDLGLVKSRTVTDYIQDENILVQGAYSWDNQSNSWVLDNQTFYYYSGISAVSEQTNQMQTLQVSPNPTTGLLRLQLDDTATVHVFNTSGQLLESISLSPGDALDLTALPEGVYQLSVRQGTSYFNAKVVKL